MTLGGRPESRTVSPDLQPQRRGGVRRIHHVFLSHSSEDRDLALKIARDLRAAGIIVWLDEWEILVGDSISQKVEEGLQDCPFVAVLLTRHSVESGWVAKEWQSKIGEEAHAGKTVILPLKGDSCEVPLLLQDRKSADLQRDYSSGLNELVAAVKSRGYGVEPVDLIPWRSPHDTRRLKGDYEWMDPDRVLKLSKAEFQKAHYAQAAAYNRLAFEHLINSRTEEGRWLAVTAAIYLAICLRNLGEMDDAIDVLGRAEETGESKEPELASQTERLRASIVFEMGDTRGSEPLLERAEELALSARSDEFELMRTVWRRAWASYLRGLPCYQQQLTQLDELHRAVQSGPRHATDRNFAEAIWVKTKSGILIAERRLTEAEDLVRPLIERSEELPGNYGFHPTMIGDCYRELAEIYHARSDRKKARSYLQKAKHLLVAHKWPYFPFLGSEKDRIASTGE